MVFGARDSGASRTLDAIRAASDRAEKTASKLGANLLAFGAGFLTAGFGKKIVNYAADVAKAADKTSSLGIASQKFGEAFERFSSRFRDEFGKVLTKVLPLLAEGFDLLGIAIDKTLSLLKEFGVISRNELEKTQAEMAATASALNQLNSGNLSVDRNNEPTLALAGARTRPISAPGGAFAEVTNQYEVIDRLKSRYDQLAGSLRDVADASSSAAEGQQQLLGLDAEEPPQRITAKQQAQQDRNNSFFIGASEAVDRLSGSIMNLGDLGAASVDLLNQGLMGTADILVDSFRGATDLGESLKQLGADLLAQFAKMLIYQALLRGTTSLLGGLGFAHGGVMRSGGRGGDEPMRLSAYAYGGVARGPQIAVYGETSRPEAYVPLPDGRSIPVTMAASGGDTFNMYVSAIDARSFEQRLAAHPRVYTSAMRRGMSSNGGDRSAVRRAAR